MLCLHVVRQMHVHVAVYVESMCGVSKACRRQSSRWQLLSCHLLAEAAHPGMCAVAAGHVDG